MKHKALVPISHSVTGEFIEPGFLVDVGHLTDDEVLMLVDMNVLVPVDDNYVEPPIQLPLPLPDDTQPIEAVNPEIPVIEEGA